MIVSFEITNAGLNTNVDPDRLSSPFGELWTLTDFSQVTVSTILYWSMIEAGLAVIAACLPTLQFLIRKVSLDGMISSVRSALSLQSMRSQQIESRPMGPYTNMRADSEVTSTAPIMGEGNPSDVLILGSVDGPLAKGDGIYVMKNLSQRHDMV